MRGVCSRATSLSSSAAVTSNDDDQDDDSHLSVYKVEINNLYHTANEKAGFPFNVIRSVGSNKVVMLKLLPFMGVWVEF